MKSTDLPFIITEAARRFADLPAIISQRKIWTFAQYGKSVDRAARQLRTLGFTPCDRMAIVLENSLEYAVLLMAMLKSGITAVPVSTRFPASQIQTLLEKIRCKNLVTPEPDFFKTRSSAIRTFPVDAFFSSRVTTPRHSAFQENFQSFGATVIFTSGSSGESKAAFLNYRNHFYSALGANENIPFGAGDRWLASLPFYHVGGLSILFRAAPGGGAVVIPSKKHDLAEQIEHDKITHLSLVPTQLFRLLRRPGGIKKLSSLKAILLGGAPVGLALVQKALDLDLPIYTTYGSTEMASQITTAPKNAGFEKLAGTSGKVLPHRGIKISSDGEILVRGKTLFAGYLNENGELNTVVDRDGWFHTADIGSLDEDGFLKVWGRKDNMFISGGENIHPEEIEHALCSLEEIEQAVVVPIDDPEFGRRPAAFIKWVDKKYLGDEEMRTFLASKIARFKIPIQYFPWIDENIESGMKLDRRAFAKKVAHISQAN